MSNPCDCGGYAKGRRDGLEQAAAWCDEAAGLIRLDARETGEARAQLLKYARAGELEQAARRLRELRAEIGGAP